MHFLLEKGNILSLRKNLSVMYIANLRRLGAKVELSGGEILIESLKQEGVEIIFGYPGGSVLHIYDALYQQEYIRHVLVRHEQGATHAADGYARSTNKVGVVLVTSGPGATNAVTGIATAYLDSIPMIVITGQVPSPLIGSDAFQEVDMVGITRPCVKHNFLVKSLDSLAETIKKAFYVAQTGRPGPVVIDIPKDITDPNIKIPFDYSKEVKMRSYNPVVKGHTGQIKKAAQLLLVAKRPMIYVGGGVVLAQAHQELREMVEYLGYPVTETLMALGSYPGTADKNVGMLGMHGTYEANMAMHQCDVLISLGARFDDRVTGDVNKFCPDATIIHVDIDPASISKNVLVDLPIVGDLKHVLVDLFAALKELTVKPDKQKLDKWWKKINEWRKEDCLQFDRTSETIKPQFVMETLNRLTGGDLFLTSDVGQHQMFAAQFVKFNEPKHWINSGGLGTMGFGLPAAIGVQLAHKGEDVFCVTGEASIQMCTQELSTCLQYDLPLKILNLNNGFMGMVRQWQEMFYDKRYSHSYFDALPDFVKLAESYGHIGIKVTKASEVEGALKTAIETKDRLVFIDFITDPEENVYPMIAAGKGHNEMHLTKRGSK